MPNFHFDGHIPPKQRATYPQILNNLRHLSIIREKKEKNEKLFMKELAFSKRYTYRPYKIFLYVYIKYNHIKYIFIEVSSC